MFGRVNKLGIIGAGKFGIAVAKAAVKAGYDVSIAGRAADDNALTIPYEEPKAQVATVAQVARSQRIVVLAIPFHNYRELPRDLFDETIVIDAMNYRPEVDGQDELLLVHPEMSSIMVQDWFADASIVKSLNQLSVEQFDHLRRPKRDKHRVAMGAASDDPEALKKVTKLIDRIGFDPVVTGRLSTGGLLAPGGPAYGTAPNASVLKKSIRELPTFDA